MQIKNNTPFMFSFAFEIKSIAQSDLNFLCNLGWFWTSDLPAIILGAEVASLPTKPHVYVARDQTQGLLDNEKVLYQLSYISSYRIQSSGIHGQSFTDITPNRIPAIFEPIMKISMSCFPFILDI